MIKVLSVLLTPALVFATGAGFVDGIWFSKDEILEGESVRVYAVVQNQTANKQNGDVYFLADGLKISTVKFTIPAGTVQTVSTIYTPEKPGSIKISAGIIPYNPAEFKGTKLPATVLKVLADTDRDKIPDEKDPDDDNDGIPDKTEILNGTDPKVPNTLNPKITTSSSSIPKFIPKNTKEALELAKYITQSGKEFTVKTYQKIDPKMQTAALSLKQKAEKLKQENISPNSKTENKNSGTNEKNDKSLKENLLQNPKLKQAAAVGLLALSFALQHWLWHIAIVGALMIIRALYKNKREDFK